MIQLVFFMSNCILPIWLPAFRAYSTDHEIIAADAEIFRKTDYRDRIFNTDHRMAFLTVEMNVIMGVFFSMTGMAAFGEIYNPVYIRYFMDVALFFKPFEDAVDRYPVAQVANLFLDIRMRQGNF